MEEVTGRIDSQPEPTFDESAKRALDKAEFWETCALFLHKALLSIATSPGSARKAMRTARKALDEFREVIREESYAEVRVANSVKPAPTPLSEAGPR